MKKFLLVGIIGILSIGLVACGEEETIDSETNSNVSNKEIKEKTKPKSEADSNVPDEEIKGTSKSEATSNVPTTQVELDQYVLAERSGGEPVGKKVYTNGVISNTTTTKDNQFTLTVMEEHKIKNNLYTITVDANTVGTIAELAETVQVKVYGIIEESGEGFPSIKADYIEYY